MTHNIYEELIIVYGAVCKNSPILENVKRKKKMNLSWNLKVAKYPGLTPLSSKFDMEGPNWRIYFFGNTPFPFYV